MSPLGEQMVPHSDHIVTGPACSIKRSQLTDPAGCTYNLAMTDQNCADVVVAGHICLDIIPEFPAAGQLEAMLTPGKLTQVGKSLLATGGTVSNTGLSLHRLGEATGLMGKVGDDLFGRAILDILGEHDQALAEGMIVAAGESTSYTVILSPPGVDRMFLHCPGANDTFSAADIDYDRLTGAKLFHFGYPPLMKHMFADGGAELAGLLAEVKGRGLTVSLDMAQPDPTSAAGQVDWREILTAVLPSVDVFLPSIEEITFMIDRARFDRIESAASGNFLSMVDGPMLSELSAELLAMGAAVVVLKLGDQGLYVRTTSDAARLSAAGPCFADAGADWLGRELLTPCFQANVVGTTGAGDATIAGFLAGLLHGLSARDSLTAAVAVGACSVEAADATGGVPAWSAVQARLAAGWDRLGVDIDLPGWTASDTGDLHTGPGDSAG